MPEAYGRFYETEDELMDLTNRMLEREIAPGVAKYIRENIDRFGGNTHPAAASGSLRFPVRLWIEANLKGHN